MVLCTLIALSGLASAQDFSPEFEGLNHCLGKGPGLEVIERMACVGIAVEECLDRAGAIQPAPEIMTDAHAWSCSTGMMS